MLWEWVVTDVLAHCEFVSVAYDSQKWVLWLWEGYKRGLRTQLIAFPTERMNKNFTEEIQTLNRPTSRHETALNRKQEQKKCGEKWI